MAPHEQSPASQAHPPRSGAAQALGVLAAVSVAGLMIARGKSGPLFFAAGAAAAGWLARRRLMREQRPLELLPQRAPDETPMPAVPASPEPPVDAWLARQIAREQESPVITLDLLDPPPAKLEVPTPVPHLDLEPPPTTEAVASAPVPPAASHLEDASVEPAAHISPVAPTASVPVPVYGLREESSPLSPPSINPFLAEDFFTPEKAFTPPEPRPGLAALQALEANESKSSGGSSWMLGIEPLPSWEENAPGETAADETPELAANFMQAAPPPSEVVESPAPVSAPPPQQPVFLPSLFQGAALPDEICVPAPQEAVETPLVAASAADSAVVAGEEPPDDLPVTSLLDAPLFPPAPVESAVPEVQAVLRPVFVARRPSYEPPVPVSAPANVIETTIEPANVEPPASEERERAPEVPVTLAEPGEASFDDPFAAVAIHGAPASQAVPPPPLRPHAPVVEAEIVVRPRGLAQAAVIPKPTATPPEEGTAAEVKAQPSNPLSPAASASALPPAPVVVPREQRARKTWRSWWRGE